MIVKILNKTYIICLQTNHLDPAVDTDGCLIDDLDMVPPMVWYVQHIGWIQSHYERSHVLRTNRLATITQRQLKQLY